MAIVKKPNYTYTGEVNSLGQPHGKGRVDFINGETCQGEFKNGKREGYCVLYYSKEKKRFSYEGYFVNDKPEGDGRIQYRNGDSFHGSFKEGKKHGYGTYFYKKMDSYGQETYSGFYHMGLKYGKFVFHDKYGHDKTTYETEWHNDVPERKPAPVTNKMPLKTRESAKAEALAYAKKINPSDRSAAGLDKSDVYEGGRSYSGKPHGKGDYRYSNGDRYIGEFSFGSLSGSGTYTSKDGSYFKGAFWGGLKHGDGIYSTLQYGACPEKYKSYITVAGKWSAGVLSRGEVRYKKYGEVDFTEKYEGEFAPGTYIPHGEGKYVEKDGSYYEGKFHLGKRHGYGKYYRASDRSTYSGWWEMDVREGYGELTYETESEYYGRKNKKGVWKSDVFVG